MERTKKKNYCLYKNVTSIEGKDEFVSSIRSEILEKTKAGTITALPNEVLKGKHWSGIY